MIGSFFCFVVFSLLMLLSFLISYCGNSYHPRGCMLSFTSMHLKCEVTRDVSALCLLGFAWNCMISLYVLDVLIWRGVDVIVTCAFLLCSGFCASATCPSVSIFVVRAGHSGLPCCKIRSHQDVAPLLLHSSMELQWYATLGILMIEISGFRWWSSYDALLW